MKTSKTPITILMPPPNITGSLHLGHALNNFIQDAIVRFYKLRNHETIWIPGFDHAGIATEILVKRWIQKEKLLVKNENDFQALFAIWTKQKQNNIRKQWKALNLLINSEYETFTLNHEFQNVVIDAFIKLYDKKLIYQKKTLVNWDPILETAIADIEVEHRTTFGKLYYIRYQLVTKQTKQFVIVATTRPETIFADQALIINPDDQRYQALKNQFVINPLNGQKIPILLSKKVKMEFGTGILKCTPGHDFNDWEIGQKLKLKAINCLNPNGTLNANGLQFAGLKTNVARQKIVQDLEKNGLLVKAIDHQNQVPYSTRTGAIIEPFLSEQWFLKTQQWAKTILKNQNQVEFKPAKYRKYLINWLEKMHDWCISRQLNWGHRLPVYFHKKTNEICVSKNQLDPKIWIQSKDVLDTWFSSGLWAIANFGWNYPSRKSLNKYFPIDFLVTSYDIIFFWIVRMFFFGIEFKKTLPFKTIIIHGLIRTSDHQKMSKSRGNVIDPMKLIDQYGSDGLRWSFLTDYKIGDDLHFDENKVEQAAQFVHKIKNIHTFLQQFNLENSNEKSNQIIENPLNCWILNKFKVLVNDYEKLFQQQQFTLIGDKLHQFIWKEFSNFYLLHIKNLQKSKFWQETKYLLQIIWKQILALLHPMMPKITEKLFFDMFDCKIEITIKSKWNLVKSKLSKEIYQKFYQLLNELLKFKTQQIHQLKTYKITLMTDDINFVENHLTNLHVLLIPQKIQIIKIIPGKITTFKLINVPTESKVEIAAKIKFFQTEIIRSEKLLNNQAFLQKAKATIIKNEKIKYKKYQKQLKFWQTKIKN